MSQRLRQRRLQKVASRNQREQLVSAIAAKVGNLDAIQKSLADAAALGAPLWVSYLLLLFYIAVAAAGVTHTDLFLENPVELPFLNIKLSLIVFFVLAPLLFLVTHIYTLAHFVLLSDKAKLFNLQLRKQIQSCYHGRHEIREAIRKQLPINLFVQFLAGPQDIRQGSFSLVLSATAWLTLVIGPIFVFLLLQLQFLPYHDRAVTWCHRIFIILDLFLLWSFWPKILGGRDTLEATTRILSFDFNSRQQLCKRSMSLRYIAAHIITTIIVLFTVFFCRVSK